MSPSPPHGDSDTCQIDVASGARFRGEFPMRVLNARMWGHSAGSGSRSSSDPTSLGGCGRIMEGGSWVPIYDTGDRWTPGSLATCENSMLCDYCGPREQAKSMARYDWHFRDHLQVPGHQLINLRLSFAHGRSDDLAPMLDDLKTAFERLRRSKAWRDAGITEWVRVLHIRWSPDTGFYPHYHVTGFVASTTPLDERQVTLELQAAWRDRVAKGIGRRVSQRHGLFARVVGSAWGALYAWHWADPDEERDDARLDVHRDDLGADYEPRHLDDDEDDDRGSWPLYRLAEAALDGDTQAWCAWMELCRAMKGVQVVSCSKLLTKVWKAHEAEQPTPEAPDLGEPVVTVGATLWEKARRVGATEMALALGRTHGVEAMAQWWHERLGVKVYLLESSPPRLFIRAGPGAADPTLN